MTLVGDLVIPLRPKVLQNYIYIFVSDDFLVESFIMFFFSSPNIEPFTIEPFSISFEIQFLVL